MASLVCVCCLSGRLRRKGRDAGVRRKRRPGWRRRVERTVSSALNQQWRVPSGKATEHRLRRFLLHVLGGHTHLSEADDTRSGDVKLTPRIRIGSKTAASPSLMTNGWRQRVSLTLPISLPRSGCTRFVRAAPRWGNEFRPHPAALAASSPRSCRQPLRVLRDFTVRAGGDLSRGSRPAPTRRDLHPDLRFDRNSWSRIRRLLNNDRSSYIYSRSRRGTRRLDCWRRLQDPFGRRSCGTRQPWASQHDRSRRNNTTFPPCRFQEDPSRPLRRPNYRRPTCS